MNYLLSICIPTYNGLEKLKFTLPRLLKLISNYEERIQVCISDNCSTDGTIMFLNNYSLNHNNIKVNYNSQNYGYAKNSEIVLKMGDGSFCWLLGNDDLPVESNFEDLINILELSDDSVLLVGGNNDNLFSEEIINNLDVICKRYSATITWISRYILAKEIAKSNNIGDYSTDFAHVSWLLYNILNNNFYAKWLPKNYIKESDVVSCSYSSRTFEIFTHEYISSFSPFVSEKGLRKVTKNCTRSLIKIRTLARLRAQDNLSLKMVKRYSKDLKLFPVYFNVSSYIISILPKKILFHIYKILKG